MRHKKFDFRTAYIDLLLNFLTSIIFIFVLTTLLIQAKKQNENEGPKKNAEYVITATWDQNVDCDVDLWVQDPLGNVVSFKAPNNGIMHIERDDMGLKNDYYYDSNHNLVAKSDENKEMWTLRGIARGEYTVNVHLYACRQEGKGLNIGAAANLPVKIEFIKLNPQMITLRKQIVVIERVWDEVTVTNFFMEQSGFIRSFTSNSKKLVKVRDQ